MNKRSKINSLKWELVRIKLDFRSFFTDSFIELQGFKQTLLVEKGK